DVFFLVDDSVELSFGADRHQAQFAVRGVKLRQRHDGKLSLASCGRKVRLMESPAGDLKFLLGGVDGLEWFEPRYDLGDQLPNIQAFMHLRPIDGRAVAENAAAQVGDNA